MGHTHLIIGAGRMGGALLKGWIRGRKPVVVPEHIAIVDPKPADDARAAIEAGAAHLNAIKQPMDALEHVIVAVKPQMFDAVAPTIESFIPKDALVTSIMAGVSLARLGAAFPERPLVRAMPNTPAAIGAGMTAFTASPSVSKEQKRDVKRLLKACLLYTSPSPRDRG